MEVMATRPTGIRSKLAPSLVWLGFLPLIFVSIVSFPVAAQARSDHPAILLLYQSQKDAPYANTIREQIVDVLQQGRIGPFELYIDAVDAWDPDDKKVDESLANVLASRYSTANVHLLIPIGNTAIEFVRLHGRELFPDASVVYCTFRFGDRPPPIVENSTGVIVFFDVDSTLQIALSQFPETRHVYVITGTDPFEKTELDATRIQTAKYSQLKFQFASNVTYAQLIQQLSTLPPDAIVIALGFARDAAGERFIASHIVDKMSRASTRPIYVVFDPPVGLGVLGGKVHDFKKVGRGLGQQALQVLSGVPAKSIPPMEGTFETPMFDWRQMQRWNISSSQLPPQSVIVRRPRSHWQQYFWLYLSAISLIILQALLITGLVIARLRERKTKRLLLIEEEQLELLSDVAATFVNIRTGLFTTEVERVCSHLLKLFALDRIAIFEVSRDGAKLEARYSQNRPDVAPSAASFNMQTFRYMVDPVMQGRVVYFSNIRDIPEEARAARDILNGRQLQSLALFPLQIEGSVHGVLAFATVRREVQWTQALLGQLQTVANIFSNALERKNTEAALLTSEQLKGNVLDSLVSSLAVIDGQGRIIAVNKKWNSSWIDNGGPPDDCPGIGDNYLDVCRAAQNGNQQTASALAGIQRVLDRTVDRFEIEYDASTPRQQRWFQMTTTPLLAPADGAVIRHMDITFRKQAEAMLRESEQRFRLVADCTPVLLWMSDTDASVTYLNKTWLEFTGHTLEEEIGNGWLDSVHPDDRERCSRIYTESFANRHPFTMEYRLRRADGRYRWLLDNGVPRNLMDGSFAGYIGGCVDVTEQKESETARSRLSSRLISAQEQERASIARELHDHINQRLAVLGIGLQQIEKSSSGLGEKERREIERLWELTYEVSKDIQTLSRQLHSSQLQHLGLAAAIRSLCEESSRSGSLQSDFVCTALPAKLDEGVSLALFRVVQESLRNAAKYSKATLVTIVLEYKESGLDLKISDNGIGFDTEAAKGRGLGLISMEERLRLIGGELVILSQPGSGTRIEAHLSSSALNNSHGDHAEKVARE
jgi:PAS domain S-box-containing protein